MSYLANLAVHRAGENTVLEPLMHIAGVWFHLRYTGWREHLGLIMFLESVQVDKSMLA